MSDPLTAMLLDQVRRDHAGAPAEQVDPLARLIAGMPGTPGDGAVPTGALANIARLYVICDTHMKTGQFHLAYRTLVTLLRVEREIRRELRAEREREEADLRALSAHRVRLAEEEDARARATPPETTTPETTTPETNAPAPSRPPQPLSPERKAEAARAVTAMTDDERLLFLAGVAKTHGPAYLDRLVAEHAARVPDG